MPANTITDEKLIELISKNATDLQEENVTNPDEKFIVRARLFKRVFEALNDAAPNNFQNFKASPGIARHESNEDHLVTLLEAGAIPWSRSNTTVAEYTEKHDVNSEYGLQVFFSTCFDAVIEGDLGRSDVEKCLANAREDLENFSGHNLPSDGSKGQAKASMRGTIRTYEWLLGEYNGEQDTSTSEPNASGRTREEQAIVDHASREVNALRDIQQTIEEHDGDLRPFVQQELEAVVQKHLNNSTRALGEL